MFRQLPRTLNLCGRLAFIRLGSGAPPAASEFLAIKDENGVREITMKHKKTLNSLSMQMMCELHSALLEGINDVNLRCIVLTAEGNVWSAGHNLKELAAHGPEMHNAIFQKITDIVLDIQQKIPVPVIAKVNGFAAAAGCQLAASCDIIVASERSKFSTPGVGLGIFCNTPGVAIGRVMSRPKSAFMLMTGLPISSHEAWVAGMVTKVVPENDLDNTIDEITCAIKKKSRAVMCLGKSFYYKQLNMPIQQAYMEGKQKMTENLQLEDCREGISSFIEKREPKWKHT